MNQQDANNILALARIGLARLGESEAPDRMAGAWQCWGRVAAGFAEMFNKPAEADIPAPGSAIADVGNGTVDANGPKQL